MKSGVRTVFPNVDLTFLPVRRNFRNDGSGASPAAVRPEAVDSATHGPVDRDRRKLRPARC